MIPLIILNQLHQQEGSLLKQYGRLEKEKILTHQMVSKDMSQI